MSRKPNIVPTRQYRRFETLIADFRRFIADPTLDDRDALLYHCAWQVARFKPHLLEDASKMALLFDTLRLLRESTGPGINTAEKTVLESLVLLALHCVDWLEGHGVTRETCRKAGLQSPDPALQPACAALTLLQSLADQCFAFCRPHDSFGGQRRSLAFELHGLVGALIDLPDTVAMAHKAVKKSGSDARGALIFLETYLGARAEEEPDDELEDALLAFSKTAKSRSLAVGALNILVQTLRISEFEALDRIDDWKSEHY